jgi:hypothetical protein
MDIKTNYVRGSWAIEVKTLLENLGFGYLWTEMLFRKQQLNAALETLYCQYYQSFYLPKLCTYKLFKNCIGFEKVLFMCKKMILIA